MSQEALTQTKAMERINIKSLTWCVSLILIASFLPRVIHTQLVTGPIINATLFLSVFTMNSDSAILVGLLPSIAALSSGLLPVVLAPVVPFIMISNAILILIFSYLKKYGFARAAVTASVVKYIFLYTTSYFVTQMIAQKSIALKAATLMMTWPQLATALAGAVIAYFIVKTFKLETKN